MDMDTGPLVKAVDRHTLVKGEDWWRCVDCCEDLVASWAKQWAVDESFAAHLAESVAQESVVQVLQGLLDEATAEAEDAKNHWTNGDSELALAHYKDTLSVVHWLQRRLRRQEKANG